MGKDLMLIDMDGVVADLLTPWLEWINEWRDADPVLWPTPLCPAHVKAQDLKTWDVDQHPGLGRWVNKYFGIADFAALEPIPGAIEAVKALDERFDVRFCTATPGHEAARGKLLWVNRHFGWGPERVLMVHEKHLVRARWIIDDKPATIRACSDVGMHTAMFLHDYNFADHREADVSSTQWFILLNEILDHDDAYRAYVKRGGR